MPMIDKRTRFFLAVEGESEQSFAKWLQELANNLLHIHLDTYVLYGGGYESMLKEAVRLHKRGVTTKGPYKDRFLLVDSDRADDGDWSIERFRQEAAKYDMTVCFQKPKHEAVLFRMTQGKENFIINAPAAENLLRTVWPTYEKPVAARLLGQRYTLNDLLRMATSDADFRNLLQKIGLLGGA
jgi:hypothetical protein